MNGAFQRNHGVRLKKFYQFGGISIELDEDQSMDRRRLLKVKLKALAAEARIIREEETKTRGQLRNDLHAHRVVVVRGECRATHLAYGFLRGRTYHQMERTCRTKPDWEKVKRMVRRYGNWQQLDELENWKQAA